MLNIKEGENKMDNTIIKIQDAKTGFEGSVQYYKIKSYLRIMETLDEQKISDFSVRFILNNIEDIANRTLTEYIFAK